MKLKKSSVPSSAAAGGPVIADRFRLDADAKAGNEPSASSVTTALVFVVLNILIIGAVVVMMYSNWGAVYNH